MSANDRQVGGRHYMTQTIQPWDYIVANGLPFLEGSIIKYVTRHRNKNGIDDLLKAQHFLEKLIESLQKEKAVITVPNVFKATHRHKQDGGVYEKVSDAQLKIAQGVAWEDAVIYRGMDGKFFVRPEIFFNNVFDELPNNETDGLALDKNQYK